MTVKPVKQSTIAIQSHDETMWSITLWIDDPAMLNEFGNVAHINGHLYSLTVDRRYHNFTSVLNYLESLSKPTND